MHSMQNFLMLRGRYVFQGAILDLNLTKLARQAAYVINFLCNSTSVNLCIQMFSMPIFLSIWRKELLYKLKNMHPKWGEKI